MARPAKVAEDLYTFEEFYHLVPDGQKADLIDGVVYMASPDTDRADDLTGFMNYLLRGYNEAKDLGGKVKGSRYAYRLTRHRAPEPDVGFTGKRRAHLVGKKFMKGGPDVAVEIVARDSRSRDYGEKKRLYEKAGVSEYWIIDPLQQCVEFYRLVNGRYKLVPLEANHLFRSKVIPGFWLDVNWLLADPLPKASDCLQELLR